MNRKPIKKRSHSVPEPGPAELIVPKLPAGFLERVIQYGLDQHSIDFDWVQALEQRLLAIADEIADRQCQSTSPEPEEITGAQRRAAQYLSWALENQSGGQLAIALAQLKERALEELLVEGENALEGFRDQFRRSIRNVVRRGAYLGADSQFILVKAEAWCDESLKDAGRRTTTRESATAMLSGIMTAWHELQVGECLVGLFPGFFSDAPEANYEQCIQNLAVAKLFGQADPRVTEQRIRDFNGQAFRDGSMLPEVSARLCQQINAELKQGGCAPAERQWFQTQWWPELARAMAWFGRSGKVTPGACREYGVYYPFGRRKDEQGPTMIASSVESRVALAERFSSLKMAEQLELLCSYEASMAVYFLEYLRENGSEARATQLFSRLPVKIAVDILHIGQLVDDLDFDQPDPELPSWALSYLRSLTGARKGAARRAFRTWRASYG